MKRIASLILALVMMLTVIPVTAQATEMDWEDPVLDYGTIIGSSEDQPMELMGAASEELFEMADIPEGGKYVTMSTSQEMVDVIKDFEGFRSKAYWDNSQWTVGYGTRGSEGMTVTKAQAEKMLMDALEDTYEPVVNDFCKKNGKQPTQQQFDAMLDLTYNAGGSWTTGSAVPDVVLNPTTALDIVKGFGAWSRSGGSVSYVHVNRRIRESLIYLYGEYYLAYGNQDCKTDLDVVDNDDLPHFKAVIFKTSSGKLSNGKTDYAAYYPVGDYYRSFIDATRSGYTLVGWKITKVANDSVSDAERISIWDKVEENLELTAVWEKGTFVVEPEEPPVDLEEPTEPTPEQMPEVEIDMDRLPFRDVPEDAWYRDAVSYVYRNGIMSGTSATTFQPAGYMTRGMLVTVLYAMDGSEPVSEQEMTCFTDIGGAYYTKAVAWAYNNGIVSGVTPTTFVPNRIVTRQEAVAILYKYSVNGHLASSKSASDLSAFADRAQVASYAKDAFGWAVSNGLVSGSASGGKVYLNPNTNLYRAQAAIMLQHIMEDIL